MTRKTADWDAIVRAMETGQTVSVECTDEGCEAAASGVPYGLACDRDEDDVIMVDEVAFWSNKTRLVA